MKRALLKVALSILPFGLSAASGYISSVEIPYPVHVGNATLEPGHYSIRRTDSPSGVPMLLFTSGTGVNLISPASTISRSASEITDRSEIVLQRDGQKYELTKIWLKGSGEGVAILSHTGASVNAK